MTAVLRRVVLRPYVSQKTLGAGRPHVVDVSMLTSGPARFAIATVGRSVSRRVVDAAVRLVGGQASPFVVADGQSGCERFVITGASGLPTSTGDRRCNPIYARCGVAIAGDCYVSLRTYRCELHAGESSKEVATLEP